VIGYPSIRADGDWCTEIEIAVPVYEHVVLDRQRAGPVEAQASIDQDALTYMPILTS
jgi:hypothetical protein